MRVLLDLLPLGMIFLRKQIISKGEDTQNKEKIMMIEFNLPFHIYDYIYKLAAIIIIIIILYT